MRKDSQAKMSDDAICNTMTRSFTPISMRTAVSVLSLLAGLVYSAYGQQPVSPREQLAQYVADLQKNPSDDAVREKIIKLGLTLEPKPNAPPGVDELAGKGEYILQHATSDAVLSAAADAFAKASLLAPWVPDYYFDQGIVWEKVKNYEKAVKNFELYLMGVPADSDDAKKARQHLGGLKYQLENQRAAEAAARAQRQAELDAERARQQAAEQARQLQEQQERQRLANLDPIVRSLDGAVFSSEIHDSMGNRSVTIWTIKGDRVSEESRSYNGPYDGNRLIRSQTDEYPIDGRTFRVPVQSCDRFFAPENPNCYVIGTISENEISWASYVNGVFHGAETRPGWHILGVSVAKRVNGRRK